MKAIRAHQFGGPDVLALDDVPDPRPGPREVLVRVQATSVNPIDWKFREGFYRDMPLPFTPGGDFSGVVTALGRDAEGVKPGDEVYGCLPGSTGADAELAVCPTQNLAPRPRTLDALRAAAVPISAMTAWQGLFDQGKLARGEKLFILGASGGVGSFAVQLARDAGARVLGTASGAGIEHVRSLGGEPIDYEKQRIEDAVHDADFVLDLVGGDFQDRAFACLRPGGRLVSSVKPPSQERARERGVSAKVFRQRPSAEQLVEIARRIDDGKIVVEVARVLPLERASEAEELNRKHEVLGKIVLRVAA
jgi:NADPH:quinone reductase-like Zn-dependent oxidoreductase